ncbi:Hypothetical predicted protein [Lecanosticta acicola]|uniref:Uncharacterized protein n=1 Tax=Lecanosticta acicola TaxID=111012 RepID=A0AAI9ECC6_9PEZI|nr:Hypothetical predicted protein [Lecanosticta acicola]
MSSNDATRDPRLQQKNSSAPPAPSFGENKKRPASRSPAAAAKPARKQSVPFAAFSQSHNGNGNGNIDSDSRRSSVSSTDQRQAPVANMMPTAQHPTPSTTSFLEDLPQRSADLAVAKLNLEHAQRAYDQSVKESDACKQFFDAYPSIKEQRLNSLRNTTNKLTACRNAYDRKDQAMQQAMADADARFQASVANAAKERSKDDVTQDRARQSQFAKLEHKLQQVDHKVDEFEHKVKQAEHKVEQLSKETQVTSQAFDNFDKRFKDIQKHIEELIQNMNADAAITSEHGEQLSTLRNDYEAFKQSFAGLQDIVQGLQDQASAMKDKGGNNGNELGLAHFRVVSAPSDEDDVQIPWKQKVEGQIEGLNIWTSSIQRQYDNLTTEHVVQKMVDQMSTMYPAAKDFQVCVNNINGKIAQIEATLLDPQKREGGDAAGPSAHEVSDMRNNLDALKVQGEQAIDFLKDEIGKIQGNLEIVFQNSPAASKQQG